MSENFSDRPEPSKVGSAKRSRITRRNLGTAVAAAVAVLSASPNRADAHWFRPGWRNPFKGGGGGKGGGSKCFFEGTTLATPTGPIAVDDLQAGDLVLTESGEFKPVVRADRMVLNRAAEGGWAQAELPVCIKRDAFAEGIPSRDVYLSCGHHVKVDGLLIPIGDLVNGTSIEFVDRHDRATLSYFHVLLDGHDILMVDGLACESLLVTAPDTAAAPLARTRGGIRTITSRLRSAASPWVDVRTPADRVRDRIEDRAEALRAA